MWQVIITHTNTVPYWQVTVETVNGFSVLWQNTVTHSTLFPTRLLKSEKNTSVLLKWLDVTECPCCVLLKWCEKNNISYQDFKNGKYKIPIRFINNYTMFHLQADLSQIRSGWISVGTISLWVFSTAHSSCRSQNNCSSVLARCDELHSSNTSWLALAVWLIKIIAYLSLCVFRNKTYKYIKGKIIAIHVCSSCFLIWSQKFE